MKQWFTTRLDRDQDEIIAAVRRPARRWAFPAMFRGGLGYLLGEAASKAITFGILIAIAPLLPVESFAYVSLYIAFANIAALLVGLGVQNAIVRFHFREVPFSSVLGTGLAIVVVVSASAIGLTWFVGSAVATLLGVPLFVVQAAVIGGSLIAIRTSYMASLRARRRPRQHAVTQLVEAGVSAGLILVLVQAGRLEYEAVIACLVASAGVITVVAVVNWARDPGLSVSVRFARTMVIFSAPMILHGLALYVMGAYGQIAVNAIQGPSEAGIYALAYRFGMAMIVLSTAFSSAWMPEFLQAVHTPAGRAGLARQAQLYLGLMAAAAALMMVGLPIAAWLVGGDAYQGSAVLIPTVVYAYLWYILYTLVLGYHLDAGRTMRLGAVTAVAMLTNILATNVLVERLGLAGAAVAAVIGYGTLFALQAVSISRLRSRSGDVVDIPYWRLAVQVAALGVLPVAITLALVAVGGTV